MQVTDFWETPGPVIFMDYYSRGNAVDAGIVEEVQYVTATGQILDGLDHLHAKGVAHWDLKPENFLVEMSPLFRVVITDFGLSKVVIDAGLQKTFCGTLKYAAPEVFPGVGNGYGPPVDIWSLGVIVLEWIYGVPTPPNAPTSRGDESSVPQARWYQRTTSRTQRLISKLDDQEDDSIVEILLGMVVVEVEVRWRSKHCLKQGFENGLFSRRAADGLAVASSAPDRLALPAEEGEDTVRTQANAASSSQPRRETGAGSSSAGNL